MKTTAPVRQSVDKPTVRRARAWPKEIWDPASDEPIVVDDEWNGPEPYGRARLVAGDAAQRFYSQHDGNECSWPITFVVELAGNEGRFEVSVSLDYEPMFFAGKAVAA